MLGDLSLCVRLQLETVFAIATAAIQTLFPGILNVISLPQWKIGWEMNSMERKGGGREGEREESE